MHDSTSAARPAPAPRTGLRRITAPQWVVIAMALGLLVGVLFPDRPTGQAGFEASDLAVLSAVFLRMIKSLIVPLLFSTLVVGIAGHGADLTRVGRLALRSFAYFEVVTTLALAVGLVAVNVVKPGAGVSIGAAATAASGAPAAATPTLAGVIEH